MGERAERASSVGGTPTDATGTVALPEKSLMIRAEGRVDTHPGRLVFITSALSLYHGRPAFAAEFGFETVLQAFRRLLRFHQRERA